VFASALLTAAHVAADSFVEPAKAIGHEVADVGQIEERQGNADYGVDNSYQATPLCLRRYVPITCVDRQHDDNNRY